MQYSIVNQTAISRLSLGTKRFPTQDESRVVHLDIPRARGILERCAAGGVNLFDTSYSNHKGEAEAFLGDELSSAAGDVHVSTSFFEMVDPRFEYVFQKQLKKLKAPCIDFYAIDGVTDMNKEVNVDSGAIDFFFAQKERGLISQIGFSSQLSAGNLAKFLRRYPWDFVRLQTNYFEWFAGNLREAYEVAAEADVAILGHGALRCGPAGRLKDDALAIMRKAAPERSSVDWALRFVKSLEKVSSVSCNMYSEAQAEENLAVFADDDVLDSSELEVLASVVEAQKTRRPASRPA